MSIHPGRAASIALAMSLVGFVAGCGGNSSSTPAAGTEQSFGDIRTRIVGTAQQPVVSAAPSATVIGIAGATISDITQSSGNRTLLNHKIVFASTRDSNWEIYTMDADGTGQSRLTNNPAIDLESSFSPDGSKIVFYSYRDGNNEIYSMNTDGTGQTRLTTNTAIDLDPSFSPDGSKIVFESERDGNYEVYSMNANGTGQTRLTNNPTGDYVSTQSSYGVFGFASAKLLGVGGAFGESGGGFLLGQKGATTTSMVTFDSTFAESRKNVRVVAQTLTDTTASNLVFTVTATDSLSSLKFYNDFATAAPTAASVVTVSLPEGTTGAVVSFDAATGKVATVLPYAANRGVGSAKSTQSGDTLTYIGSFSGVWNATGENVAPSGASTVRLNIKTGALLGFE